MGVHVDTQKHYAIKLISRRKIMNERNDRMRTLRLRLLRDEGLIMKHCNSPHVIKCYEVIATSDYEMMVI